MIEVLPAPENVLALRVSDVMDADDYQDIIDQIEFRLVKHERISVFADLLALDHVTAPAVIKRIAYSIAKIGEWQRFPRVALLTDKYWVSAVYKIFSALIPHVEIRTFDRDSRTQAMSWVYGETSPSLWMSPSSISP